MQLNLESIHLRNTRSQLHNTPHEPKWTDAPNPLNNFYPAQVKGSSFLHERVCESNAMRTFPLQQFVFRINWHFTELSTNSWFFQFTSWNANIVYLQRLYTGSHLCKHLSLILIWTVLPHFCPHKASFLEKVFHHLDKGHLKQKDYPTYSFISCFLS